MKREPSGTTLATDRVNNDLTILVLIKQLGQLPITPLKLFNTSSKQLQGPTLDKQPLNRIIGRRTQVGALGILG